MDNNMLYWLIEYGKVLFGYGFLMFVWPLTIFRKYLKNKSVTFKFSFCVTAQVVIVNTVVLMLGLLHILNDWTLRILFYGSFLYSIRACFALTKERKTTLKYLVHGSFGVKNFIWLKCRKYIRKLENVWAGFCAFYKKHWLEYSLLIVAVVYGVMYFSWGVFHDRVYGFSDMNVHHSWIYQLSEGKAFSAGIYPEGMHCVVYALNALFGIRLYSCMLLIQPANLILICLAMYCFMKEVFHWRMSAIISLVFMLTFGGITRNVMISMARLQCALPQEFAFPAVILCCMYLFRYLKGGHCVIRKGKKTKGYWDEDLLVFLLAFTSTIVVHFYATMMAFFLCLGVALFLWKRIFTKKRFFPLVASVIIGLFIAVVPMVAGFASGIPLQGSLYWAMSIIQGSSTEEEVIPQEGVTVGTTNGSNVNVTDSEDNSLEEDTLLGQENSSASEETIVEQPKQNLLSKTIDKIKIVSRKVYNKIKSTCEIMYVKGLQGVFEIQFSKYIALILGVTTLVACFRNLILWLVEKKTKIKKSRIDLSNYFLLFLMLIVYMAFYIPGDLGLPGLIEKYRIGFMYTLLVAMIFIVPLDYLFALLSKLMPRFALNGLSTCALVGVIALVVSKGWFHSYLYFELIRYDSVVQVTNKIIDALPEETYTIVSPTEEIYQVIEYGWHEELIDFVTNQRKEEYTLPTEYVFLIIEKKPLRHAQYHFHSGPKWLAENNYRNIYGVHSVYPEYLHSEISEEAAEKTVYRIGKGYDSYKDMNMRTIIESKAYKWCEVFDEKYPNELKVFYDDEFIICYYWRQNPYRLYNLSIE